MSIVIADTGVIISLVHVQQIDLIEKIFGKVYISQGVWEELSNYINPAFNASKIEFLESQIVILQKKNYLLSLMDLGESESVILYEELDADYLLIDDKKARQIAESFDVNCIGTIGVLIKAKEKGFILNLKPLFEILLKHGRYFSINFLNQVLKNQNEDLIE